jgi:hypothetical protein
MKRVSKMELEEIKYKAMNWICLVQNWIYLAQDTDRECKFVNTAINFRAA